jgi:hypothetical protein
MTQSSMELAAGSSTQSKWRPADPWDSMAASGAAPWLSSGVLAWLQANVPQARTNTPKPIAHAIRCIPNGKCGSISQG